MNDISESPSITLDAALDLLAAVPLKERLAAEADRGGRVELDASMVERLSTPCAQILISAARTLAERGDPLVLTGASEAFTVAIADLGLEQSWQRWVEAR